MKLVSGNDGGPGARCEMKGCSAAQLCDSRAGCECWGDDGGIATVQAAQLFNCSMLEETSLSCDCRQRPLNRSRAKGALRYLRCVRKLRLERAALAGVTPAHLTSQRHTTPARSSHHNQHRDTASCDAPSPFHGMPLSEQPPTAPAQSWPSM